MKKILCMIMALLMCLAACTALVSCGCDHVFASEWSTDDTHHWHVCTKEECDEQGDKAEHAWNEGVLVLAPTPTTTGVRKYTCTECGVTKTEIVEPQLTVNKEEWTEAFLLRADNFVMTVVNGEGNLIVKKRGGIVMTSNPQAVNLSQHYYTVEGGKYYCYTVAGEQVTKGEITEQAYTQATTLIDLQDLVYGAFTYNENGKTYEAAEIVLEHVTYENVYVSFLDGKLTRASFTKKEAGKASDVNVITVTYGTVPTDLVLPQVTQ